MRGDLVRIEHRASKDYARVLQQQGRVPLDEDWNDLGGEGKATLQLVVAEICEPTGEDGPSTCKIRSFPLVKSPDAVEDLPWDDLAPERHDSAVCVRIPLFILASREDDRGGLRLRLGPSTWPPRGRAGAGPSERAFEVRRSAAGASIVLGDGRRGRRPPSADSVVAAEYRTGAGKEGNVPASALVDIDVQLPQEPTEPAPPRDRRP